MAHSITNISFELHGTHEEFSFKQTNGTWGSACLQFPDISDSQNFIDGIEEIYWRDEDREIFKQLESFYYNAFKDVECAAAAAIIGKNIVHVEKVDELYVAFTLVKSYLIKESRVREYFHQSALFDFLDDFEDLIDVGLTEIEIKRTGKKAFFKGLNKELTVLMQESLDAVEAVNIDDAWIEGAFDEVLHSFMNATFSDNYGNGYVDNYWAADDEECDEGEDEISSEFYQNHGCDIRADFEREAREKMGSVQ